MHREGALRSFRVAFFKATDKTNGHAIKSHMKMFGVDGRLAIVGGSNMLPTAPTGNNDCDCLVDGEAAEALDANFAKVWLEQTGEDVSVTPAHEEEAAAQAAAAPRACRGGAQHPDHPRRGEGARTDWRRSCRSGSTRTSGWNFGFQWHERNVRFVDVMSRPGSQGEDAILRGVIGLIAAKEEFLMCMLCGASRPARHAPFGGSLRPEAADDGPHRGREGAPRGGPRRG